MSPKPCIECCLSIKKLLLYLKLYADSYDPWRSRDRGVLAPIPSSILSTKLSKYPPDRLIYGTSKPISQLSYNPYLKSMVALETSASIWTSYSEVAGVNALTVILETV